MATSTASKIVVFFARRNLFRKRAKFALDFEKDIRRNILADGQAKRIKDRELYYGKLIPYIYFFFRFNGCYMGFVSQNVWRFLSYYAGIIRNDLRVTAHKACALEAQTFMIAMAKEGYDT